jgi:transcriptional regulator with XRE-family HTH domain
MTKAKPDVSFNEEVGCRLRIHREKAGVRLADAAKHIGITEGPMSRKESGKSPVEAEHLSKLAALYGCGVSDLIPSSARTRRAKAN